MSLYISRAENIDEFESERGSATIYEVAPSLLVSQAIGHVKSDWAAALIARSNELIEREGSIEVFHDWFEVTSYDPAARRLMTPWAIGSAKHHRGVHIGFRNRVVKMGVNLVGMASGAPVHVYATLNELELAMAQVLRSPSLPPDAL